MPETLLDPYPAVLVKYLPVFLFELINLLATSKEEITVRTDDRLVVRALIALKYVLTQELVLNLRDIFNPEGLAPSDEQIRDFFRYLLEYLARTNDLKRSQIMKVYKDQFEDWGYLPGSAYEKWILKGEAKGEARGEARGEIKGRVAGKTEGKQISVKVIKLFNQGLSVEEIVQQMAIEEQEVKEIIEAYLSDE